MRCDVAKNCEETLTPRFQSLLGFLMRCDHKRLCVCRDHGVVSIPVGFSDALRHCVCTTRYYFRYVSIPVGFSDALRLPEGHILLALIDVVSIPVGFSDALRPYLFRQCVVTHKKFQSLLGFLMRCDDVAPDGHDPNVEFQSLLGFLMRCDTRRGIVAGGSGFVSIPVGFSDALRRNAAAR